MILNRDAELVQALQAHDWEAVRSVLHASRSRASEGTGKRKGKDRPRESDGEVQSLGVDWVASTLIQLSQEHANRGCFRCLERGEVDPATRAVLAEAAVHLSSLRWPHHVFGELQDKEILAWLTVFEAAPLLGKSEIDFLERASRVTPRDIWIPAARILGRAAGVNDAAFEIVRAWAAKLVRDGKFVRDGKQKGKDARHHVVAFAALVSASPERASSLGLTAQNLFEQVPNDQADRSALVLAAAEMARCPQGGSNGGAVCGEASDASSARCSSRSTSRTVERFVERLLMAPRMEPQLADAFVHLASQLSPAHQDQSARWLVDLARRPSQADATTAIEWVSGWLVLARALHDKLPPSAFHEFLDTEPDLTLAALLQLPETLAPDLAARRTRALPMLGNAIPRRSELVEAIVSRLAILESRYSYDLVDPVVAAAMVEEAVALCARREASNLSWAAIARKAGWPEDEAYDVVGAAGSVARLAVVLAANRVDLAFRHHAREASFEINLAIAMSKRRHEVLETQLALSVERHIRRVPAKDKDVERLTVLYRLLQNRPTQRFWKSLKRDARDAELENIAKACLTYLTAPIGDDRDRSAPYVHLLEALRRSLPGASKEVEALERISQRITALRTHPLDKRWHESLQSLFADPAKQGFALLLKWCNPSSKKGDSGVPLQKVDAVKKAIDELRDQTAPSTLRDRLLQYADTLRDLNQAVEGQLPQPEEDTFQHALEAAETQVRKVADELRKFVDEARTPGIGALNSAAAMRVEVKRDIEAAGMHGELVDRALAQALSSKADAIIHDTLERRSEAEILTLVGGGNCVLLLEHASESQVGRLRSWLLDRCLLGATKQLAKRVSDAPRASKASKVATGIWSHFAPLLVGVAFGTTQVFQVGIVWNDLLKASMLDVTALLSVAALAGTYAYVVQRFNDERVALARVGARYRFAEGLTPPMDAGRRRRDRLGVLARRAAPLYGASLLIAFLTSAFVLALTRKHGEIGSLAEAAQATGTSEAVLVALQLLLWTSMTLFLGVFLGFIAQGRKLGE